MTITTETRRHIDILPTSVIDIAASDRKRREGRKDFDKQSSRAMMSEFPPEAAKLAYQLFLHNCTMVFDPFAGWGERHYYAKKEGIPYTGFDLNPAAIQYAKDEYGVDNIEADSLVAKIPKFDGLLTCPPYWNLEKYSTDPACGSQIKTWDDFLMWYEDVWCRCYFAAKEGATFVIVTGDWRKNHYYYDLTYQTAKSFDDLGAKMIDSVVLSRQKISKIKIMIPQAVRCGYTVKVHETMQIFRKEKA